MITDIGHIALRTNNLEESIAYYELFGIRESFRLHHEDGSIFLVYLHVAGDRFIELFPPEAGEQIGPQKRFLHLCLLTDDIHKLTNSLKEKGVPIDREPVVGLDGNWQAWTHDPDGNLIELMQLEAGSPQRRVAQGASG